MTHRLKIKPEYYQAVFDGIKNFEVRKNDRDFKVGDILILCEYDPFKYRGRGGSGKDGFSGREITEKITYILDDETYCKEGFVIIGFAQPERVQICNVTQNGNNSTIIGSVATFNMG